MLKYNNRPSIKYILFTAICALLASPMLQAVDTSGSHEYEGETILKDKLTDKQQKGIDDYGDFLKNKTANNSNLELVIRVQFDGKLLLKKKIKEKATFKEAMNNAVRLDIDIKDIEKSLKEKKGDSFDIKKDPVSRKELTAILRKELHIDKLEKDTGLHASLKLFSINAIMKKYKSMNHIQGLQQNNVLNVVDGDIGAKLKQLVKNEEKNEALEILQMFSDTRLIFYPDNGKLETFSLGIIIELETPAYKRKKLTKKWGKRILIGTAIASPLLLLIRFFYGYGKQSKVRKSKGAGKIAVSSTSKTTTDHVSTERVSTEANSKRSHTGRRRNRSKRKDSA